MRFFLLFLLLIIFPNNSFSRDYLMDHFEKKSHWLKGETIKIAAYDSNGIAFVYLEKFIKGYELEAAGKDHCNRNNKEIINRERSFHQQGWATIIFRCR